MSTLGLTKSQAVHRIIFSLKASFSAWWEIQFFLISQSRTKLQQNNFFWKWSSRWAEKDAVKQKVLTFQEDGQKRKMVIKIEYNSLTDDRLQYFTLFRKGFKKWSKNIKIDFLNKF